MMRLTGRAVVMAALVAALAALFHKNRAAAEEDAQPKEIKIGLVSSLFPDTPQSLIQLLTKPLKTLMESQTGMSGTLIVGGDAASLAKQLKDDEFQLAVFHGVEFAWVRQKYPNLKPLVIAVKGQRILHAHLLVNQNSKITSFADLKGKTVAFPRKSREHCQVFLERRCQGCGQCYKQFFGKVTTPSDSEDGIDDVVDGVVEAAIIDSVALDRYQGDKPERFARLKSVVKSEPFPAAVLAYNPGVLSEDALKRFHDGLLNANKNPKGKQLLSFCRINCFEDIPENYDEMLTNIAKAYPPPSRTEK
jgi:ABC-type phosphate/phosphonate transport system substrate-binding protein